MQLNILTLSLPWSLVKAASLYVMDNLGQSMHVYCIEQVLQVELPVFCLLGVELLDCRELNSVYGVWGLSVLISPGVVQGVGCNVWAPGVNLALVGRQLLGEVPFMVDRWWRSGLTIVCLGWGVQAGELYAVMAWVCDWGEQRCCLGDGMEGWSSVGKCSTCGGGLGMQLGLGVGL